MRGRGWKIRYEGGGPEYNMRMTVRELRYERGSDSLIRTG